MPQTPLKKPAKGSISSQLQYDERLAQVSVTIRFSTIAKAREFARTMAQAVGDPMAQALLK